MSDAPIRTGGAARISIWLALGTPALVALDFALFAAVSVLGDGRSNGPQSLLVFLWLAPFAHLAGIVFGIVAMAKGDNARLGALGVGLNVAMIALGIGALAWLIYVAAGAIHMN